MAEAGSLEKFIKTYNKDDVIVEENSRGDEMFLISSGRVVLTTAAPGRNVVLASLGPGEFFGEMSLVDAAPRIATAIADEDNTRLVSLDQQRFIYLVSQQPAFALTVMHELCQRIRNRWELYEKLFSIDPHSNALTD